MKVTAHIMCSFGMTSTDVEGTGLVKKLLPGSKRGTGLVRHAPGEELFFSKLRH